MKDFTKEIDKSYPIPSQIAVMSGDEPIDMRQTCDSVEDFEKFKSDTGMCLSPGKSHGRRSLVGCSPWGH